MKPIDFDIDCVKCGYSLRGRPALGRCSECGASIGLTIRAVSRKEVPRPSEFFVTMTQPRLTIAIGILGLITMVLSSVLAQMPTFAQGLIAALLIDAASAGAITIVAMMVLRAPASWFNATLVEVWCSLTLGTGLFYPFSESCSPVAVLLLAGLPVICVSRFLQIQAIDAWWFFVAIGVTRALHLLT